LFFGEFPDFLLVPFLHGTGFCAGVSLERAYSFSIVLDGGCGKKPFSSFTARFSLVKLSLFLFHAFIEFVEIDICENRRGHSPYTVANFFFGIRVSKAILFGTNFASGASYVRT
jgi:hypothetical protein